MLLTLIKMRQTRFGIHAQLIEKNQLWGNRILAELFFHADEFPLELCYPVTIPRSGICLRGKTLQCKWPNATLRKDVFAYLRTIQTTREEIIIDVTHYTAPISD